MTGRLRHWAEAELSKLRPLSKRQRAEYIWMYYRLWILGVSAFAALTVFLTVRISTNIDGYWLYGIFANTRTEAGTGSALWQDFADYAALDLREKKLEFNAESYFDYLKNQARGNNYYHAFIALSDGGVLDFVAMEAPSLTALAESGRLYDLRLEPCTALCERYADRLLFFHGQEGDVPVGFDLSDSLLVTKYGLYGENCALGICAHSENIALVAQFLQFVLEEG